MNITEINSNKIIKSNDLDEGFIEEISKDDQAKSILTCFECGTCSSSCPIVEFFPLKPHQMTRLTAVGAKKSILNDNVLRTCLTCMNCQIYCPKNIDFYEYVRAARTLLLKQGLELEETHDGILSIIAKIQANREKGIKIPPDLVPNGYKTSKKGKVAYFTGCLPIFETIFDNIGMNSLEIAQNGIKVLNKVLDEPPVIFENAKCCGHDALWKGDFETFKKLAEHNVQEIKKLGVKKIITTCAECYRTLTVDYPKYIGNIDFEVIHLSELIADKLKNNQLKFSKARESKVTYHDPCRLGRHMKVYDPPREIISAMNELGITFNELERSGEDALCCGVSCFINCNDLSRAIQLDRLSEAKKIADTLVTTCPKCQIHYNCALHEKKERSTDEIDLKISDLTNLIAKMMGLSE